MKENPGQVPDRKWSIRLHNTMLCQTFVYILSLSLYALQVEVIAHCIFDHGLVRIDFDFSKSKQGFVVYLLLT